MKMYFSKANRGIANNILHRTRTRAGDLNRYAGGILYVIQIWLQFTQLSLQIWYDYLVYCNLNLTINIEDTLSRADKGARRPDGR